MFGKLDTFDNFVAANNTTPSDDKESKMRMKKVLCLKVLGMTVLAVLSVISIKDTAEKEMVQIELAESIKSHILNHNSNIRR